MSRIDPAAVAVNAAGIADAFRVLQISDPNGETRLEELTRSYEGWSGVMLRIAEAGEIVERFRAKAGATATWGGDMPYLYDVWDAIAETMWTNLGNEPLDELVQSSIEQAMSLEAV